MAELPVEILSRDDVESLVAAPDREEIHGLRDAVVLATLYYAAATASDVVRLDVEDVDFEDDTLRLPGRSRRRVSMEEELTELLEAYLERSRPLLAAQAGGSDEVQALFLNNRGGRMRVQDLRQMLGATAKAAGLAARLNLNTPRLSRAWHLREEGESPETIQKLLGTASRSGRRVI